MVREFAGVAGNHDVQVVIGREFHSQKFAMRINDEPFAALASFS